MTDSNPEKARNRILKRAGFTFPRDLARQSVYFTINTRTYESLATTAANQVRYLSSISASDNYYHLPLPISGLNERFGIEYNNMELGAVGGTASAVKETFDNPESIVGNVLGAAQVFASTVARSAGAAAGDLVGRGDQVRALTELGIGAVANPNIAVLFRGVSIREHTFSWRFIPRSIEESLNLKTMLNQLKRDSLPKKAMNGASNFLLAYPDIAYVFIKGPASPIITFNPNGSFITNIDITYNGDNNAFFKETNEPVDIGLRISFRERSILTSEDIGKTPFEAGYGYEK